MTTPDDIVPVSESLTFSGPASRHRDGADLPSQAQEINERRARVENAELLAHLRSL